MGSGILVFDCFNNSFKDLNHCRQLSELSGTKRKSYREVLLRDAGVEEMQSDDN